MIKSLVFIGHRFCEHCYIKMSLDYGHQKAGDIHQRIDKSNLRIRYKASLNDNIIVLH